LVRNAGLIAILASGFFALGLGDVSFVDEYAYITQSYQPDLLFSGRANDPAWLESLAYDLVPLPKYLINLAFRMAQIPRPNREAAIRWYGNSHYTWGSPRVLTTARLPSIPLAAIGCMAIFALGVLVKDEKTGWIAAVLLAVDALYRLHAHRAMSEAPCEAFSLLALAMGLWAWRAILAQRNTMRGVFGLMLAGCLAGVAILAKFTGILALMCLGVWSILGIALPGVALTRKLILSAGTFLAIVAAWLVFLELNPTMTSRPAGRLPADLQALAEMGPWDRFRFLIDHRRRVSRAQQHAFSHNAVYTLDESAKVVAVQGFGRFGPFGPSKSDSLRRYDLAQDWGAICWLPLVLAGSIVSIRLGLKQFRAEKPPMGWAVAGWASLAVIVVTAYLPMAWDRYQMPIQAPAALLAALALAHAWETLEPRFSRVESRP
jgi:4-amino-4-deoxy-L-arabinose transferase-like glycosyltransferase